MCVSMRKHNNVNREIQMLNCVLNCVDRANQLQFRLFHFHHSLSPKTLFGASRTPLNLLSPSPLVHDEGLLQIFRNSEKTV